MSSQLNSFSNSVTLLSERYLESLETDIKGMLEKFPTLTSVYCAICCKITEEELRHFYKEMNPMYGIYINTFTQDKVSLMLHRRHVTMSMVKVNIDSKKAYSLDEALELYRNSYKSEHN